RRLHRHRRPAGATGDPRADSRRRAGRHAHPVPRRGAGRPSDGDRRAHPNPMKPHVQLLGLLQLAWGGMGLLLAASLLLLGVGAAAIARTPGGDTFTATFTSLLFVVFAAA